MSRPSPGQAFLTSYPRVQRRPSGDALSTLRLSCITVASLFRHTPHPPGFFIFSSSHHLQHRAGPLHLSPEVPTALRPASLMLCPATPVSSHLSSWSPFNEKMDSGSPWCRMPSTCLELAARGFQVGAPPTFSALSFFPLAWRTLYILAELVCMPCHPCALNLPSFPPRCPQRSLPSHRLPRLPPHQLRSGGSQRGSLHKAGGLLPPTGALTEFRLWSKAAVT